MCKLDPVRCECEFCIFNDIGYCRHKYGPSIDTMGRCKSFEPDIQECEPWEDETDT